mgnify:CR=1 FL=1|jgi:hypothetical protein
MLAQVCSRNGIPIRLTQERWLHILRGHPELAGWEQEILYTIEHPEQIFAGPLDELLALREVEAGKWLVVVYREFEHDGFIITAFFTRKISSIRRNKRQIWP